VKKILIFVFRRDTARRTSIQFVFGLCAESYRQFNFDTCRSCFQETRISLLSVIFPFQKRLVIPQTKYEIQTQLVVIFKIFVPNWEYFTKSNDSPLLLLSDGLFGWDVPKFRRKGRLRSVTSQKSNMHSLRYRELVFYRDRRVVTVCQFNKRGSVSVTD
jgi:hypothetical protein